MTLNPRGIDVDGVGSLIIRNSASDNGLDYEIAANNRFGEIVHSNVAPQSAAVSGSSSAGVNSIATTNPWANFSY